MGRSVAGGEPSRIGWGIEGQFWVRSGHEASVSLGASIGRSTDHSLVGQDFTVKNGLCDDESSQVGIKFRRIRCSKHNVTPVYVMGPIG